MDFHWGGTDIKNRGNIDLLHFYEYYCIFKRTDNHTITELFEYHYKCKVYWILQPRLCVFDILGNIHKNVFMNSYFNIQINTVYSYFRNPTACGINIDCTPNFYRHLSGEDFPHSLKLGCACICVRAFDVFVCMHVSVDTSVYVSPLNMHKITVLCSKFKNKIIIFIIIRGMMLYM